MFRCEAHFCPPGSIPKDFPRVSPPCHTQKDGRRNSRNDSSLAIDVALVPQQVLEKGVCLATDALPARLDGQAGHASGPRHKTVRSSSAVVVVAMPGSGVWRTRRASDSTRARCAPSSEFTPKLRVSVRQRTRRRSPREPRREPPREPRGGDATTSKGCRAKTRPRPFPAPPPPAPLR